jgi:hypothetical protein
MTKVTSNMLDERTERREVERGRTLTDTEMARWRQAIIEEAKHAATELVGEAIREHHAMIVSDVAGAIVKAQDDLCQRIDQIPAGPQGERGPVGTLQAVQPYVDKVHYAGDVVAFQGSCYQARIDTGKSPPHADWICLVERGIDGRDGLGFRVCGLFRADQPYNRNDVCVFNKAAWVAKYDSPGALPGDGWYLLVGQGRTGDKGPPGPRGQPGPAGETVTIIDWELDPERYLATPLLSDGSKARPLSLRPFFERYHGEVA